MNMSGQAVRGLVKSRAVNSFAGFARDGIWRLCSSPAHESRQPTQAIGVSERKMEVFEPKE